MAPTRTPSKEARQSDFYKKVLAFLTATTVSEEQYKELCVMMKSSTSLLENEELINDFHNALHDYRNQPSMLPKYSAVGFFGGLALGVINSERTVETVIGSAMGGGLTVAFGKLWIDTLSDTTRIPLIKSPLESQRESFLREERLQNISNPVSTDGLRKRK